MKIDLEQVRDLLQAVSQTDITELTIESGDEKITVRKSTPVTITHAPTSIEAPVLVPQTMPRVTTAVATAEMPRPNNHKAEETEATGNGLAAITSPMVGTFYRASGPAAPAFVEVGDRVSVGQTVCIIEAMKLMNDLPSEVSGKIVKILVENGTTVEFGQQLFLVDPNG